MTGFETLAIFLLKNWTTFDIMNLGLIHIE